MLQLLLQPLWLIDLYQFLNFSLNSVDRNNDSNVLDNIEAEESVVMTADTGASVAVPNSGLHCAVLCDLAMTPCPSIGKKKAKDFAQQTGCYKQKDGGAVAVSPFS